jgi:putative DNA primase/helicase
MKAKDANDILREQGRDALLRVIDGAKPDSANIIAPAFSDEGLAVRFADENCDKLRYVAVWGKWLQWTETRWKFDETLFAWHEARKMCRAISAACNNQNKATQIASSKTINAVVTLARSDRRLAATVDQWDSDPLSLNTPAGVVDLNTGKLRAQRPSDYMTKITAVAPDNRCSISTWLAFLNRITGNDVELISFLQRISGYALTGSVQEHALFFLHGSGANGKSTFLNAITGIAGDYHRTAAIETFTASTSDRHPTDLAGLRGARLVTAVETEEGRRWAESKIKALTGGDKIAARFMRQDFFEFVPSFKLMIAGNHRPGLRSVDEAIRRRFHLVPFNITIPPEERDPSLGERLRDEWPGILAWMIEGCLQWQQRGLEPPAAVQAATAEYLESEDALAAWLDESGTRDPTAWETTKMLFASWKTWSEAAGEYTGSQKRFVQNIETRGLTPERKKHARGFRGFRIGFDLRLDGEWHDG